MMPALAPLFPRLFSQNTRKRTELTHRKDRTSTDLQESNRYEASEARKLWDAPGFWLS